MQSLPILLIRLARSFASLKDDTLGTFSRRRRLVVTVAFVEKVGQHLASPAEKLSAKPTDEER